MKKMQNLMKRFLISAGILIVTFGCVNQSLNEFSSPKAK
jgi:hypothetical protein